MDAATPRDLDQLDTEALKALILALREQVFSHRKQLTTQQKEKSFCSASSSLRATRKSNT
jgi:ribosomal protein L29